MSLGPTGRIVEKVVQTGIADAPPDAVRVARDLFFDTVGVILAGSIEPGARIVREFALKSGGLKSGGLKSGGLKSGGLKSGEGPVTVIGTGARTSAFMAALANGTAAAILDYDDSTWRMIGHPSGCVVPAVLAFGEERHASGRDVLEAYMVGHEAIGKIARGVVPGLYMSGRHTTGALGIFGATAACAKLLGLDAEKTAIAFGIAASCSGAIRSGHGTMTKGLHSGEAAANGILAASLAAEGFTAQTDILERKYGFADTAVANGDYDLSLVGQGWGDPWDFVDPVEGAGIKLMPSGTTSFCAGECAMEIARRPGFDAARVAKIAWRTTPLSVDIARYGVPEDRNQAFYSVGWAIAAGLVDGRVGLAQFDEDRIRDPLTRDLCAKVDISLHPDLKDTGDPSQSVAGELVVTMKDGSEERHMRLRPRAYPGGEPWTREQLLEKYREAGARALDKDRVEASIDILSAFDELDDIGKLTAALRAG